MLLLLQLRLKRLPKCNTTLKNLLSTIAKPSIFWSWKGGEKGQILRLKVDPIKMQPKRTKLIRGGKFESRPLSWLVSWSSLETWELWLFTSLQKVFFKKILIWLTLNLRIFFVGSPIENSGNSTSNATEIDNYEYEDEQNLFNETLGTEGNDTIPVGKSNFSEALRWIFMKNRATVVFYQIQFCLQLSKTCLGFDLILEILVSFSSDFQSFCTSIKVDILLAWR